MGEYPRPVPPRRPPGVAERFNKSLQEAGQINGLRWRGGQDRIDRGVLARVDPEREIEAPGRSSATWSRLRRTPILRESKAGWLGGG
jgi:hypothetical protein